MKTNHNLQHGHFPRTDLEVLAPDSGLRETLVEGEQVEAGEVLAASPSVLAAGLAGQAGAGDGGGGDQARELGGGESVEAALQHPHHLLAHVGGRLTRGVWTEKENVIISLH